MGSYIRVRIAYTQYYRKIGLTLICRETCFLDSVLYLKLKSGSARNDVYLNTKGGNADITDVVQMFLIKDSLFSPS